MARSTFRIYVVSLLLLLAAFLGIALWGSFLDDFEGWKVSEANGPLWQIAMLLFFYSGMVSDVAFIRTCVVLANIFITAWAIFGVPHWPNLWYSPLAQIRLDQLVWCLLCVAINALPMLRQFKFDDSEKTFDVGSEYTELAESMWREWWRRSGIPRADFKSIVEAGEFVELVPGQTLRLTERIGSGAGPHSYSEGLVESGHGTEQDVFYYVVSGKIHVQPEASSGRKEFTLTAGYFLDDIALMAALGQTTVAMAMQTAPPRATVLESEEGDGAIVLRWSQKVIDEKVVRSHGFASVCMKTVVSSATLDSLYSEVVSQDAMDIFAVVEQKRKELARAPLPRNAAMHGRSLCRQFAMSHISFRDLWEPSPHQRVVNATVIGSREKIFRKELEEARASLRVMRITASEALHLSSATLPAVGSASELFQRSTFSWP